MRMTNIDQGEALGTHQGETVGSLNSAAVWEHLKQGGKASL